MSNHPQPPRRSRPRSRERTSGATLSLGRIAGVRVGVHWTVVLIFALLAYLLSGEYFPRHYAGYSTAAYVAAGMAAAVVFLVSLLAHEMSHALVARRHGQQVEGITLWLLGGVARLHGEARDPAAEVRVAGVGPLVSAVLGVVFLGSSAVLVNTGGRGLAAGVVFWLGLINVILAVFNSVPAAPLDGGRLLRAFLWWRTGDPAKASVWASRSGQGFGWVLVVLGVVSLFQRGFLTPWLALVGFFLITAASWEGQQAAVRGRLAGVPVWHVMTPEPVTVPADTTAEEFVDASRTRHRYSAFPVTGDAGEPIGLVTFDRVTEVPPGERSHTRLGDVCLPLSEVVQTSPEESIAELLPRLGEGPHGRALVFAGERLAGIVSPQDVNRLLERMSLPRQDSSGQ